jgi:hypothetical protein
MLREILGDIATGIQPLPNATASLMVRSLFQFNPPASMKIGRWGFCVGLGFASTGGI